MPTRTRLPRAERERQILDAALVVFAERGFQNASMDAVAERVGVTKPVVYTHFGSKEGLLLACLAQARAELLEVTTAAAAAADRPEETLRQGTLAFFRYVENRPAWSLMCAESAVAGEALEGIRAQQTDFVAGLLAAWVAGRVRPAVDGLGARRRGRLRAARDLAGGRPRGDGRAGDRLPDGSRLDGAWPRPVAA